MDIDTLSQFSAAQNLEGQTLASGWVVGPRNERQPGATGGVFSVSYPVTRNGERGFMKVIDLVSGLGNIDRMQNLINEYVAERDLLLMCAEQRLSRIVVAVDHGQFELPEYPIGGVYYIIFEMAESDVRIALSREETVNLVFKLEVLHSLTAGLRQLHGQGVAHQDVKPSNLLVFSDASLPRRYGKVGDLGRAYRTGHPSMHDEFVAPGDRSYAPPEQLYGHVHPDIAMRRYASDLYQLGNVGSFIFAGATINSLLSEELAPEHHWAQYGDDYTSVLPYVRNAYGRVIERLRAVPEEVMPAGVVALIHSLCDPEAERRGHPRSKGKMSSGNALSRILTDLDLMAKRAIVSAANTR